MKKVLFVLLGLVVVLFLVVLVAGLAAESVEYENRIVIERPAEEVWAVFTDASRMKEWMDDLDTIENLSGNHLEVGSRWRLLFGEDELLETVTAVEPGKRYAFDMETEVFLGDTDVRLVAKDGGTELISTTRVVGNNVLLRGMFAFMKRSFVGRTQEQYERLKARVEGPK